ncbi:uncharacterized protein LOC135094814 isoform X2 [Scylla paramamosain]|uniref:uncharacterized protein LOC135094814 isoform X2 n=1 Tax=Scylla paramamosain TaxID=85552 RepID=UPI003082CAAE
MEGEEFRQASKEITDFIISYLDNIRDRRVLPKVEPGYLRPLLPDAAPDTPDSWQDVMKDIERVIMPGVTHWHSPQFHAYFPTANTFPSILADMLSAAIGCIGFSWISSPACTELEVVMMDWLGKLIGLPPVFLASSGGPGGGVIQGTASEATLVAMLAAKAKVLDQMGEKGKGIELGDRSHTLVAYFSEEAHSSVERACMLASVTPRKVKVDDQHALRGDPLKEAVKEDKKKGLIPFMVVSTMGTTGLCAFDNLREIGEVAREFGLWHHVDAAYAGASLVCEEFRYLADGVELADSFDFNPHKWLLVNFDCSAMWLQDSRYVVNAFSVDPLYLKHDYQGQIPDYRHWQIPLGRRFRSLKLWFVMRLYGKQGLQAHIRKQVSLAHQFEDHVKSDPRFIVTHPVTVGLVCFRLDADNEVNENLLKRINASGVIHLVPDKHHDFFYLRFVVCSRLTEEKDVELAWREVARQADLVMQCGPSGQDMFSARLIRKKVEKAGSTRVSGEKKTAKRKNDKVANKPQAVRSKRLRMASTGAGGFAAVTTTTAAHQDTSTDTDINKNKVTRSTLNNNKNNNTANKKKDKQTKRKKHKNLKKKKEGNTARGNKSTRVPVLYKNSERDSQHLCYDSETSIASLERENHQDTFDLEGSFTSMKVRKDQQKTQDLENSFTSLERENHQDSANSFTSVAARGGHWKTQDSSSMASKKHRYKAMETQQQDEMNASLVGECLTSTATERGSVVAALAEDTTLYLHGCVVVRPLLGSVEILGYVLQQGESQAIYSLPSISLLGVTAQDCVEVEAGSDVLQGLPSAWVEDLVQRDTKVTILEVLPHSSPRVNFLVSAGWGSLGKPWNWQKPWHSVGASVVTPRNCFKTRITHIRPEWREAAQTVATNWGCGAVPRVVVCGGKGVGKSTFFKYLANTLISTQPDTGILCLDFDPGQPELSLPTSLSLTHLTKPLLGPAFTHNLEEVSLHHRHILVGAVSPQFVLEEYVSAVQELCKTAGGIEGDLPLLVNTMGWTQGTGLGLMLDVLRLVQPTHVIQIQDRRDARNYPFPLDAGAVSTARGGIATHGDTEMHYSLTLLPSAGPGAAAPNMAQPKVQRELRVLAEAGRAAETGHHITVPWGKVALHVCEEQVPRERILQALNAQLVALCHVEPANLHTLQDNLPQLLATHTGFGDLLGWAVVMGVDSLTGDLHLATNLPPQQVTQEVNALIMPRIHLPASFYKLFCVGMGPYLEEGSREGAGRLRVGRKIKPRGPK